MSRVPLRPCWCLLVHAARLLCGWVHALSRNPQHRVELSCVAASSAWAVLRSRRHHRIQRAK
eukprot:3583784-Alexandrium_andersonii.AAC.1